MMLRWLIFVLLLALVVPVSAQETADPKDQKVYSAIATQLGLLEMAKVTLQVQLEMAQAEITRLKKELDAGKTGGR